MRLTGLCDKICCNYAQCAETARQARLPGGGTHGRSLLGKPLPGRDNGGCLTIQPGGLLFTTQKIQVPRDKRRIFIPFADLRDVGRSRVLGFPAVQLETEAQGWEFVIFRRAAFLRELRSCWLGREISF